MLTISAAESLPKLFVLAGRGLSFCIILGNQVSDCFTIPGHKKFVTGETDFGWRKEIPFFSVVCA